MDLGGAVACTGAPAVDRVEAVADVEGGSVFGCVAGIYVGEGGCAAVEEFYGVAACAWWVIAGWREDAGGE